MTRAWLGLGANLGDPRRQLQAAIAGLHRHPGIRVAAVSALYRTQPVDPAAGKPQPDYLNAAVAVETALSAEELLRVGLALEAQAGRRRTARNAARELDIDVLLFGNAVIHQPGLVVPHPRLAERGFALAPLAEIAGREKHPVLGVTIAELASRISMQGVQRLAAQRAWWEDL